MSPMRLFLRCLCISGLILGLSACVTNSILVPYTAKAQNLRNALNSGAVAAEKKTLTEAADGQDKILYLMELGRLNLLTQNPKDSLQNFSEVTQRWDELRLRARISLSHTASEGASLLTNDNALPYEGRPFEKIFLHEYQALNYLATGKPTDALVEVRNAEFEQRQVLLANDSKVYAATRSAQQQGFNPNAYTNADFFSGMNAAAGRVKNAFQNAYAFYISALIYEAAGQLNDAYIDDKKALEIWPDNPTVRRDVLRIGTLSGMSEVAQAAKAVPHLLPPPLSGSLVVLYEQGWVPVKQNLRFPIVTSSTTNYLAVPIYSGPFMLPQPLNYLIDQQPATTSPLVDVVALATFDLKQQLPGILARQWLRLLTKQKMQRELNKNAGDLGSLFGVLLTAVTDQADVRSWSSLPANAQTDRVWLAPGAHSVVIDGHTIPVNIQTGHTTILLVSEAGQMLSLNTYAL